MNISLSLWETVDLFQTDQQCPQWMREDFLELILHLFWYMRKSFSCGLNKVLVWSVNLDHCQIEWILSMFDEINLVQYFRSSNPCVKHLIKQLTSNCSFVLCSNRNACALDYVNCADTMVYSDASDWLYPVVLVERKMLFFFFFLVVVRSVGEMFRYMIHS